MLSNILKNFSILKKFLFINFIFFLIISIFTTVYIYSIQPSLIKDKSANHYKIIDNTINHIQRLNISFIQEEIRKFLISTKFLFQTIDRVIIYDKAFNSISDTDALDLDPRSFSRNFEIFETDISNSGSDISTEQSKDLKDKSSFLKNKLNEYLISENFENPFTFTHEINDQFLLVSVKNILVDQKKVGYIAVIEESNDIKFAFIERKNFVLRTAAIIALVILIFSFVLNRYFLKPIKNLVHYTEIIKDKSKELPSFKISRFRFNISEKINNSKTLVKSVSFNTAYALPFAVFLSFTLSTVAAILASFKLSCSKKTLISEPTIFCSFSLMYISENL